MVVTAAIAIAGLALDINKQRVADKNELRTQREQQSLNNDAIFQSIEDSGRAQNRASSQRRLSFGAAGVRGGSATASSVERDANQQARLEQERLARGLDFSLKDARTQGLNDIARAATNKYLDAVYNKPAKQFNKEFNRVRDKVKKAFRF